MSFLPDGERLRAVRQIDDARQWALLPPEVWSAASEALRRPQSLLDLAVLSPGAVRAALTAARVARVDEQGRPASVVGLRDEGQRQAQCAVPSFRGLSPVEAAQVGFVWRVARASVGLPDAAMGAEPITLRLLKPTHDPDLEASATTPTLPHEPHPKEQVEAGEWFEVVYSKVFVKKAPCKLARSWGWVHQGQKIQVTPLQVKDSEGHDWVELTFTQLAHSCTERLFSDDPLGRGFAMVDGTHLGLGMLLSGPLPIEEWPRGLEEAQCKAAERVILRRLSGERISIKVGAGELVSLVLNK
ncbi:unnamed protein product, partial [Polarella glacialis]